MAATKKYDPSLDVVRVVSEPTAIELVDVSPDTWDRLKRRGESPPVTRLSDRRIGYRVVDLIEWLDKRRVVASNAAIVVFAVVSLSHFLMAAVT